MISTRDALVETGYFERDPDQRWEQTLSDADRCAEVVFRELVDRTEQLAFFPDKKDDPEEKKLVDSLSIKHPGRMVLSAGLVFDYRCRAGYMGAGFDPAMYDEIMKGPEKAIEDVRFLRVYPGLLYIGHAMDTNSSARGKYRSNKIIDEICEEPVVVVAPDVIYDGETRHFIMSEDDLKAVFRYDFLSLRQCRDMDFDILYERKD